MRSFCKGGHDSSQGDFTPNSMACKCCRYVHNDSLGVKFSLYAQRHNWRKIFPLDIKAIFAILCRSMYDLLDPFVHRKTTVAHSESTKAFSNWSPETAMLCFPIRMGIVQGKRTVFSTRLCIGGQQWPTQSQPRRFQSGAQRQPCCASSLEMGIVQGKRTVFSTRLCIGGQQWPTQSQPRRFKTDSRDGHAVCTLWVPHPPPPVPPFLLKQNLSLKVITGSDVTR